MNLEAVKAQKQAFKLMEKKHAAVLAAHALQIAIGNQQGVGCISRIDWSKVDANVKRAMTEQTSIVIRCNRQLDRLQWSGFSQTEVFDRMVAKHQEAFRSITDFSTKN